MAFLFNLQQLFKGVDIGKLTHEINSLEYELSHTKEKMYTLSKSLVAKDKEIESLKQSNGALTENVSNTLGENSLLVRKISCLNQTLDKLIGENEELKDKCERITKSNASLNKRKLSLINKVKVLEKRITQLEKEHTILQSDLSDRDATISAIRTNLDNLQSELDRKELDLEEAKSANDIAKTEKLIIEENIALLKEDNVSLRQQIEKFLAEKNAIGPYMYLIEDKKKQEARANLLEAVNNAKSKLDSIHHEEVKKFLTASIESSQNQINSDNCSLEVLKSLIDNIQSNILKAENQEEKLIEKESEQKRKDNEDVFTDDTLPYIYMIMD